MPRKREDWPKRTSTAKLNGAERERLRQACLTCPRTPVDDIARELGISCRTVHKHYAKILGKEWASRSQGHCKGEFSKPAMVIQQRPPARPNLYRSNFEPT